MSEMVKQVARGLTVEEYTRLTGRAPQEEDIVLLVPSYLLKARAAIEAMREPNELMIVRGSFWILSPTSRHQIREVWDAMIDEALKGEG